MREYAEELEVRVDTAGRPTTFRWRGRRYRVLTHLAQWQQRTQWWREESTPGAVLEHPVWRVEASVGSHQGVFDLVERPAAWALVGVMD